MSKIMKGIGKDKAKGSSFLKNHVEYEDKAMKNCRMLNELFLEIRLEVIREKRC